jgi:hypothetical protein
MSFVKPAGMAGTFSTLAGVKLIRRWIVQRRGAGPEDVGDQTLMRGLDSQHLCRHRSAEDGIGRENIRRAAVMMGGVADRGLV